MGTLRTVTLNTGFDDYYTVSGLAWGGLGRMHGFRSVCSGKGISCARTAVALGVPTKAYALIGIDDADHYSTRLEDEGMDHFLVPVPGATRHNLTLLDATDEKVGAPVQSVMAGDAFVAGLAQGLLAEADPEACIARALAAAAAHVAGLEGPALREQAERNVAAVRSERLT